MGEARLRGVGPLMPPGGGAQRGLRQQVFDCVRAAGLIPRVDVAKELGVSPASVTAITSELIERGLIREVATPRPDEAARGRPPVALGVRAEAGAVAGIKLSAHNHTAVVLDFAGRRLGQAALPSRASRAGLAETVAVAADLLARATASAGMVPADLDGIGVGLPGVVDSGAGQVLWSPIIDEPCALGAALSARLDRPVRIENDANMVTLAELWFGAGRGLADFVVVTIEHGVGMGLVLNHRLYRGTLGRGMEIGHTKVELDGALCRCGQRGCLEAYVADYALVREASTALNQGHRGGTTHAMLDLLYAEAKAGNAAARAIFDRAGRYLALGLANVINLFDPSLIILSGERMRYDYLYAKEVLSEMAALTLNSARTPPRVEINAWGDLVWAQGAAALALDAATSVALSGDTLPA